MKTLTRSKAGMLGRIELTNIKLDNLKTLNRYMYTFLANLGLGLAIQFENAKSNVE